MSYYELWTILNRWRKEISTSEFARTFSSPNPRKVLHDMAQKGLLEHVSYGTYRVRSVEEYRSSKNEIREGYDLLRESCHQYALTDVDSVFVWTNGGYNADRFFGYYPIHLKVKRSDISKWKSFFNKHGKKAVTETSKPAMTLFGVFYVMYPRDRIKSVTVNGLKVEPLKSTVEFCKRNIYTYEPALEMLDKDYHLGLGAIYSR